MSCPKSYKCEMSSRSCPVSASPSRAPAHVRGSRPWRAGSPAAWTAGGRGLKRQRLVALASSHESLLANTRGAACPARSSACGLTNNVPLHEVEAVQVVDGLLGVVRTLIHDVRRALRLELARRAQPHLPDRPVLAEQVVEVRAGDVEVAAGGQWELRGGTR